jgi:hypothetical protein
MGPAIIRLRGGPLSGIVVPWIYQGQQVKRDTATFLRVAHGFAVAQVKGT